VGAGIFALFYGHGELRVQGPFSVLPIENCDVRASVDGVVGKIYVHEGDYVRAGQPIAQLVDIDTLAALDKTEQQIAQTNATLKKLVVGPTEAEIEVAKAAVTKAGDALKYAQIRLTMMKRGLDEKLVSQKEYEDAAALEAPPATIWSLPKVSCACSCKAAAPRILKQRKRKSINCKPIEGICRNSAACSRFTVLPRELSRLRQRNSSS